MSIYRYFCGVSGAFVQEKVVSGEEIGFWKARGIDTFVWTVNEQSRKTYLRSLNVAYITDDCRS